MDSQVLVKITAAGLCGTDLHFRCFSIVLGHEGVGVVEETGPNVQDLRPGDRVGWGYQHNSCQACKPCLSGDEIYCPDREIYGESNLDQGAFATHAIWNESFLLRLPDNLSSSDAAPLMCAGATVFAALKDAGPSRGDRVGIIGMGGLGHLAVQFAAKQGRAVVVFSRDASKKQEALDLGAHEFCVVGETAHEAEDFEPLSLLLVTTSYLPGMIAVPTADLLC